MLFKAKSLLTIDQLNDFEIEHDNGYVVGWLVGKAIVEVGATFEEENILGWWTNVDMSTLTPANDVDMSVGVVEEVLRNVVSLDPIVAENDGFEPSIDELSLLNNIVEQEPIVAVDNDEPEPSIDELSSLNDIVVEEPIVAVDKAEFLGMDMSTTPDRTVVSTMPYLVKEGLVTLGSGSKKSFITVEPTVIATSKEALEAFEKYKNVDTIPMGTKLMHVQPHVEILTFIQEKARLALEGDNVDEAIYGLEDILQLVDEKLKGVE